MNWKLFQRLKPKNAPKFFAVLFGLTTLLLCLILTLGALLPAAVEREVNRILDGMVRHGAADLHVQNIGLFSTDFSFSLNPENTRTPYRTTAIHAASIQYRPLELLCGHVRKIRISGIELPLLLEKGMLRIPAMELWKSPKKTETPGTSTPFHLRELKKMLPVAIDEVEIQGFLLLTHEEAVYLPFSAKLRAEKRGEMNRIKFQADLLHTERNTIAVNGVFDLEKETIQAELNADVATERMPQAFRETVLKNWEGALQLTASARYLPATGVFEELHGNGKITLRYASKGFQLNCAPEFSLDADQEEVRFKMEGFRATVQGQELNIALIQAVHNPKLKIVNGEYQFGFDKTPDFRGTFTMTRNAEGGLKVHSELDRQQKNHHLEFPGTGVALDFGAPEMVLDLLAAKTPDYRFNLTIPDVRVKHAAGTASLNALKVQLTRAEQLLKIQMDQLNATGPKSIHYHAPLIELLCHYRKDGLSLRLHNPGSTLTANEFNAAVKGIQWDIPVNYPLETADTPSGTIRFDEVLYNGVKVGSLNAGTRYQGMEFTLAGKLSLLNLNADFASVCNPASKAGFTLNNTLEMKQQPLSDLNLPEKLLPEMIKHIKFSGNIDLSAQYQINPVRSGGFFRFQIKDGSFQDPESKLSLEEFRIGFEMPELPRLESKPNQLISFKKLQYGNILLDSGRGRFRMETPTEWYLERFSLNWCEGQIRVESTKFSPENKRTVLTLHCDRVKLPTLLEQFGLGKSAGDGAISGTIPVILSKEDIRFRNGFLYSTPGEIGTIQLSPSEAVTQTTDSSAQLSLAVDALKDFVYTWSRVTLNTEDGKLMLKLQADGKPKNKLYYAPSAEGFSKSKTANEFLGIQLDVNFTLPLSDAMQVYQNFNKLFHPSK